MQQSNFKAALIYGFAIFAMFFGSGNIVFPIEIGYHTGASWIYGYLGLIITAVLLPFLGLFVIKLHRGSYKLFFAEAGTISAKFLPLFILSLLGSFGVVPRCITVAHGGVKYLFPEISLYFFSAIFCVIMFILCISSSSMIRILGKWMSPILLITLLIMVFFGIKHSEFNTAEIDKIEALSYGFTNGYKTMDLFAALFFSSLTFAQLKEQFSNKKDDKELIRFAIKPSIIGMLMLAIIYLGFVYLGAYHPSILHSKSPELMLPTIASHTLGNKAALFIAIIMIFSCITTAIALNNIYADFLKNLFKFSKKKYIYLLFLTTLISFLVSLYDFSGIQNFLKPTLSISYPGLIFLTIFSIITKKYKNFKIAGFYLISFIMTIKIFI